jgi:hypothetical protein
MLDLVPLARPRWEVTDGERETGLVSEVLQFELPQPDAVAVAAAAVGGDEELSYPT